MGENDDIPDIEGVKAAIDVTKLLITLAGAGIAFVLSAAPSLSSGFSTAAVYVAIIALGISIASGLLVLFQSATNLSNRDYSLSGRLIQVPGIFNTVCFLIGVMAVGTIAISKIHTEPIKKTECLQFKELKLCKNKN